MIRKISICICLFFAVLLTSCGGRIYQDPEVVISDVKTEKQAVVVFKAQGKQSFLSIGNGPKVSFDLAKVEPFGSKTPLSSVFYRVKPGFFSNLNPWAGQWKILMIEPGFYIIDNISWESGNTTYYTGEDWSLTSRPVKYGAFEVKPGTVNYLGNLEFGTNKKCELVISHTAQFSEAKEMLRKSHPEIAERLTQIEFFPGGYSAPLSLKEDFKGNVPSPVFNFEVKK